MCGPDVMGKRFITVRNSSLGKGNVLHLSVILFTAGRACVVGEACVPGRNAWQGRHAWQRGHVWQRGYAWRGACVAGRHAWQGECVAGGHARWGGGHAWQERRPLRTVRILLECILVVIMWPIDLFTIRSNCTF